MAEELQAGPRLVTVIQAGGGGEGLRHGVYKSRQAAMGAGGVKDGPWAPAWVARCPELCVEMHQTTSVCTDSLSFHFNAATETPSHSPAASQDTALKARE